MQIVGCKSDNLQNQVSVLKISTKTLVWTVLEVKIFMSVHQI
jgi:hypothetical protein